MAMTSINPLQVADMAVGSRTSNGNSELSIFSQPTLTINGHRITIPNIAGSIIVDGQVIHTGQVVTDGRYNYQLASTEATETRAVITISPASNSAPINNNGQSEVKIIWSHGNCQDPAPLSKHHDFDPGADFGIVVLGLTEHVNSEDEGGEF